MIYQGKWNYCQSKMSDTFPFTKHLEDNFIKFRFIDSLRFMAGLAELASYLRECPELHRQFSNLPQDKFRLLTQKGVYPYDHMVSWEKFNDERLPPKAAFYSKLTDEDITDENYLHAQTVWQQFNIRNLSDYSYLYMKTDILLLVDVFEKFREGCLNTYELDPSNHFTLPGFTWDCMLKHTNIVLELLMCVDMIMFVEDGIRDGLSQCSLRYPKANNKYMPVYDANIPDKYLLYTDINNQYGWTMSQYLPYGGFKWMEDVNNFNVLEMSNASDIGYLLEMDLEYLRLCFNEY